MKTEAIKFHRRALELMDSCCSEDWLNYADANFHIGILYANSYSHYEHIHFLSKAYRYYCKAKSINRRNNCLVQLSAYYRNINKDSAYKYLNLSLISSYVSNDSTRIFSNLAHIARALYFDNDYTKSKDIALHVFNNGKNYIPLNEICFDLCKAYARIGNSDSARHYFNLMEFNNHIPEEKYKIFEAKEVLAIAENQYDSAYHYFNLNSKLADSIENAALREEIFEIEKKFDNEKLKRENAELQISKVNLTITIIIITFVLVIAATSFYIYHRHKVTNINLFITKLKGDITELERDNLKHKSEIKYIKENLNKTQTHDSNSNVDIKPILNEYVINLCHLNDLNTTYDALHDHPEKLIKIWNKKIKETQIPDEFWIILRQYVNYKYENAFDKMINCHSNLKEKDIKILTMICCGYTHQVTAICCGYSNDATIKTKLNRMKKYIGINCSITDYLKTFSTK